jgi:DNA replication protein DnaC
MSWEDFCKFNNVGVRFQRVHIAKCDKIPQEIIDQGIDWCQKPHSLLIHGPAGRGKTHFTYCLVREAIRLYGLHQVRWTKSKALDDHILKTFNQYGDTAYTIRSYSEAGILFIDDFGVDRSSERTERDYYELIDSRWENMQPTIITTNLTPELLEEKYGSRIFSRLKDSKWIRFEGVDLRGGN